MVYPQESFELSRIIVKQCCPEAGEEEEEHLKFASDLFIVMPSSQHNTVQTTLIMMTIFFHAYDYSFQGKERP